MSHEDYLRGAMMLAIAKLRMACLRPVECSCRVCNVVKDLKRVLAETEAACARGWPDSPITNTT